MNAVEALAKLDWLMSTEQIASHADILPSVLRNSAVRREFYSRLSDPTLVDTLRSAGCFWRGTGRIRGSLVPELGYLARVAPRAPEEVKQVLVELRTLSPQERRLFIRAVKGLGPDLSIAFTRRTLRWISEGRGLELWHDSLPGYVEVLARGGYLDAAMAITRRAIGFRAQEDAPQGPPTRLAAAWYESFLAMVIKPLVAADGPQTLRLLCSVLETSLRQQFEEGHGDYSDYEDLSYMWRPAIEDHEQNSAEDPRGALVSQIRNLSVALAKRGHDGVLEVIKILASRPWKVFTRLSLHVLRICRDPLKLVRARLLERSLFEDPGVSHEYYHLLHDCYGLLSADDQAVILGWIDEGPDQNEYVAWFTEQHGSPPLDDQVLDYCDSWRIRKLMPIAEFLPADWKQRFDGLVARVGLPEHPDFPVYRGTWVGPTSPLTLEAIRAMEPPDLIAYVRGWSPPQAWDAPTPEGLGRLVTAAVADDPSRYVPALGSLTGVEATYVRSFFDGLRQGIETEKSFEWGPVLDLAKKLVHSPWPTPRPCGPVHERDSDWSSTRKTIAAVIEAGLGLGPAEVPISFRETVWQILEALADDPDPTPEDEERYGNGGFDAVTMSINTVRGRAMHTIVQYGLWVMRHASEDRRPENEPEATGAAVPEIWPVLERHLDVTRDPSLAVRSVYGQWFPWIHLLGREWAISHVDQIFPRDSEQALWWAAAWVGYVMHTRPFDDVLPVLRLVYEHAVKLLGPDERSLMFGDRPSERLGEHLVTYAWRGKLDIDPIDPLLEEYWAKADPSLRRHVLNFVGRTLREWPPAALDPGIPPAIERLKTFWAFAVSRAARATGGRNESELSAFAWWFASGQFDDDWAFEQLELVLKNTSLLDEAFLVAERLVETAAREPLRSVRALDKLVRSDREGWRIGGWKNEARKVLEATMGADDAQTRRARADLVNCLVAKGHLEFRELVETDGTLHGGEETQ